MRPISIQIGKTFDGLSAPASLAAEIDAAIEAAVKEEREACAKVADEWAAPGFHHVIALAIRKRGQA